MNITKEKIIFCWSGGKDSSLTLYKILNDERYEVACLLTTLNSEYKRISMHGIREDLLDEQAASIGLPLEKVWVTVGTNEEYERQMEKLLLQYKAQGITKVVFGDIFLSDLRKYREDNLAKVGMSAIFPLWNQNTELLVNEFILSGFKSFICCVNDAKLGKEEVGSLIDDEFVKKLPKDVDPCGENGEFHSFVWDGPIFNYPLMIERGEKIFKPLQVKTSNTCDVGETTGFWYCEMTLNKS